MLKNTSTSKVVVSWDGKSVEVPPGGTLDVAEKFKGYSLVHLEARFANKSGGALKAAGSSKAPDKPAKAETQPPPPAPASKPKKPKAKSGK